MIGLYIISPVFIHFFSRIARLSEINLEVSACDRPHTVRTYNAFRTLSGNKNRYPVVQKSHFIISHTM